MDGHKPHYPNTGTPNLFLVDAHPERVESIIHNFNLNGVSLELCHSVQASKGIANVDAIGCLLLAADQASISFTDEMLEFMQMVPLTQIILISDSPVRLLITQAVQRRIWVEIPKQPDHSVLLRSYLALRGVPPELVIDDDPEISRVWPDLCGLHQSLHHSLPTAHSIDEVLVLAAGEQRPIFLNLRRRLPTSIDSSILVYSLCPAVFAILAGMGLASRSAASAISGNKTPRLLLTGTTMAELQSLTRSLAVRHRV